MWPTSTEREQEQGKSRGSNARVGKRRSCKLVRVSPAFQQVVKWVGVKRRWETDVMQPLREFPPV